MLISRGFSSSFQKKKEKKSNNNKNRKRNRGEKGKEEEREKGNGGLRKLDASVPIESPFPRERKKLPNNFAAIDYIIDYFKKKSPRKRNFIVLR